MKRLAYIPVHVFAIIVILAEARWSQAAMSDCIDATCRITAADGSRGTGCVFEIGRGHVYVLTAAHVVGGDPIVQCEFWREGHRSRPLPARVIAQVENDRCDAAVVALATSQFGGRLPGAVPLAPRDRVLRPGDTITSVGCARGAWSTGWKGHALGYRGGDLCFSPTPADGRSGSAIFDAEGREIVGLLRARTIDGSEGIACNLQTLYAALGRRSKQHDAQCGPGGCPLPQGSQHQYRFLPYRQEQEWRRQQSEQPVWPTLPDTAPAPAVDLTPIAEKLDGIAELLLDINANRRRPAEIDRTEPATSPQPPPDRKAIDVAEAAVAAVSSLRDESKRDLAQVAAGLDDTQQTVDGLHTKITGWIAEQGSLKQRMEARLERVKEQLGEEAGRREVRIAYLKDLISEKLAGGGVVGLLKLLGMPAAVIVAAWFVSRRIQGKLEAGEPLLIQKLVAEVGELKGRLHGRLNPDGRDDAKEST